MVLLFWAGSFFKDQPADSSTKIAAGDDTKNILVNNLSDNLSDNLSGNVINKKQNRTVVLITAVLLISGPLSAQWLNSPIGGAKAIQLPRSDGEWSGPIDTQWQWNASFEGATSELNGEYVNGQDRIQLYVAYYALQKQGAEIVNSENTFYDKTKWRRTSTIAMEYQSKRGETFKPGVLQLKSDTNDKILWHWYEINEIATNDPLLAKSAQVKAKLLRKTQASAVIIILSDINVSQENTQNTIRSFVDQMLPSIKASIYQK